MNSYKSGDMIKSKYKIIGILLTIISFIYIFYIILNYRFDTISFRKYSIFLLLLTLFIISIISIISLIISSFSWKYILEFLSQKKIKTKEIINVYLKSNISKYLPGNVMQFAARNFLGKKFDWDQKQIAYSSVIEIILSTLFTLFVLIVFFILNGKADLYRLSYIINYNYTYLFFSLSVLIIIGLLIWSIKKKTILIFKTNYKEIKKLLIKCFFVYILNFIISSSVIIVTFYFFTNISLSISNIIAITEASILAYFIGFIAIGSPAGIGVRESIMIILLLPICNPASILIPLAILRLTGIIGDVLAYFIIIIAGNKKKLFEN